MVKGIFVKNLIGNLAGIRGLLPAQKFKPVSVKKIREIDRLAIEKYGIPGAILMENAGKIVAQCVEAFPRGLVTFVCGGGNNGGDGLVAARHLFNAGVPTRIFLVKNPTFFSGDARIHWRIIHAMKIPYTVFHSAQKLIKCFKASAVIVDSLLGTGVGSPLRESVKSLIELMNRFRERILSVDVPSGLEGDSGQPMGLAVRSNLTITMGLPKKGLLVPTAQSFVGHLRVADIGYPRNLVARFQNF